MIRITRPNLAAWVVLAVGVGLVLVGLSFEVEAALVPADQSGGSSSGLWVVAVLPLGVGALFVCLGGWLLTSARRYAKLVRRLLAAGVATTGKIIDNDASELWIRGNLQRKLRYEYTDNAGVTHVGLSDWMPRADALRSKPQTTGVVRYDPDRPEASAWFGSSDGA